MNEQFDKTENSMSMYYTINRVLLILHAVLGIFFTYMEIYILTAYCLFGILTYLYAYRLLNDKQHRRYYKTAYYELWTCSAIAACILGMGYGFHLLLLAMLLPVALSAKRKDMENDTRFFKCDFTKNEGICLVIATIIVYIIMQWKQVYDISLVGFVMPHNKYIQNMVYMANTIFVIVYMFYYLNSYVLFIDKGEESLRQKADYDELTKLYNRNRIRFILEHNYTVAQDGNNPFGVAIMDIDDFKKVNDIYGHNAGDFVLKRFAAIVNGIVKKCEGQIVAGRWGGEEFLIIYYGENREDFYMLLEYIRMQIFEAQFLYDRNRLSISVTIGMAAFEKELTLDEIINNADMKLYEGKKSGKNRVM